MKSNLKKFEKLGKKDGNTCFLYGGKNNILAVKPTEKFTGSNFEKFKEFAKKHENQLLIGYISYDTAYDLYKIKQTAKDDLKLPKIYFLAFDKWTIGKSEKVKVKKSKKYKSENFKTTIKKSAYLSAYKKIKEHIKKGDIYQINLTHRLEGKTKIPAKELFLRLLAQNSAEFCAYIENQNFEIISASPERFIKIKNGKIETSPIKGTIRRGKTKKQDAIQIKKLLSSEKEEAELNMITDLLRNDMGKVCKIGSVKVKGHRLINKCEAVIHTYSKIIGELDHKYTNLEALISMLPGGSITGCPKKRAIEIIDKLEPKTRSVYTGVIGYIAPKKNNNLPNDLDFNIAIRTIIKKNDRLYLQVGGGIVMDSKAKNEYQETLDKAQSLMKVL